MRKRLTYIFFGVLLTVALAGVLTHQLLRQFIFPRTRVLLNNDKVQRIRAKLFLEHGATLVTFPSTDGITLHGLAIERDKPVGTIVLCHGYRGSKESLYGFADMFPTYNLLYFDFRGHGDSEGDYVTIGDLESRDVEGAVAFAKKQTPEKPVVILGVSMGASAALKALERNPKLCDAIVLDSPYATLLEVMQSAYDSQAPTPRFPFFNLAYYGGRYLAGCDFQVNPQEYMAHLQIPAMLIHSCTDEFINPDHAMRLYAAADDAPAKVRFWLTPPAKHGYAHREHFDAYKKMMGKFFKKFLKTGL